MIDFLELPRHNLTNTQTRTQRDEWSLRGRTGRRRERGNGAIPPTSMCESSGLLEHLPTRNAYPETHKIIHRKKSASVLLHTKGWPETRNPTCNGEQENQSAPVQAHTHIHKGTTHAHQHSHTHTYTYTSTLRRTHAHAHAHAHQHTQI